jgi:fructokinase
VQRIVKSSGANALRVCDLNIRPPYSDARVVRASLHAANVAKMNEDELSMIRAVDGLQGDETAALACILDGYALDLVALTRGARGSRLFSREESVEHPGVPVDVVDTVGAGDAFTAALTVALLREESLEAASESANRAAARACTRPGGLGATDSTPKPSADPPDHKGG